MEQSHYVDVTLALTKRLREEFPRVGVCLQAYLFRTREDLEDVMSKGIGVRLVKGAYAEPATVAFPKKSDVDANYYALAQIMQFDPISGMKFAQQNRDAQMRSLLMIEHGIAGSKLKKILQYNGMPITARFITDEIGKIMHNSQVHASSGNPSDFQDRR